MIIVKEVSTRKDIRLFATYPLKLYKNCPYYVPSLSSDEFNTLNPNKNFSLAECDCKCFLAYRNGELVGRIAGIINHTYNRINDRRCIRFSRFDCINDIEVFKALLSAVERYGARNGMDTIHGPWGFNDTDREGMLTYGFDKRSTYATNYYYPYFCEKMPLLGYSDESKWIERSFTIPKIPYEKITRICNQLKRKLKIRDVAETMTVKEILARYGDGFFETLNEAYGHLDGYVPVVGKAKENVLKQFATIVNTRYISFLVDENEEVAGFGIVLPSICNALIKHKGKLFPTGFINVLYSIKKPKELEMALIGIKSRYKNSGINSIIINRIMMNVMEDGIEHLESNPMLETNLAIQQQWKFAENEIIKRRQTYIKPIEVAE